MNLTIDIFQNHFKAVFPELFFVTAIIIILVYGVMYNPSAVHRFPILTKVIGWLAAQTLTLTLLLMWNGWNTGFNVQPTNVLIFHNVLILDDFSLLAGSVILLSALSSIFISFDYIKGQKINSFEYIILILFSTLSMLFIVSAHDLVGMYLAIELQSLSFYVIAASQRDNEFSAEAGLKYFILGALSSGLLLFGESILYGLTGITSFEELTKLFTFFSSTPPAVFQEQVNLAAVASQADDATFGCNSPLPSDGATWFSLTDQGGHVVSAVAAGLLFMLVAFLFKISAVPFHMWAPDVYEGAPTSVTAFFAITPKVAILSLLLRLCLYTFYDLIEFWQQIIIICSFLSMLIGTLGAINQKKIKRLLAYSSIAHVGYLLIGLATGTIEAVESLLVYIVVYVSMIINVFGIILSMSKENYHSFDLMTASPWAPTTRGAWRGFSENHPTGQGRAEPGALAAQAAQAPSHDKVLAGFQNGGASKNVSISATQPTDYADPAYSTGPNSSFVYMLRTGLQLENGSRREAPRGRPWSAVATLDAEGTSAPQERIANWEKKYLKAGQPLWDPSGPFGAAHAGPKTTPWPPASLVNNLDAQRLAISAPRKKDEFVKSITDFSSLSKANPTLAVTFAIILFSNAGIPPLAGFFGKLNVFLAAVEGSMYFLAISGILCSAMGAFYSIRLIKIIYFHRIDQRTWHKYKPISKESSFMLGFTFFFTLFFFLYPSFLFTTTHSAALSLCL